MIHQQEQRSSLTLHKIQQEGIVRISTYCFSSMFNISYNYKLKWILKNILKYTYHNKLISLTLRKKYIQVMLPSFKLFFALLLDFYSGSMAKWIKKNVLSVVADFHALRVYLVFQKNQKLSRRKYIKYGSWITVQNYFYCLKITMKQPMQQRVWLSQSV